MLGRERLVVRGNKEESDSVRGTGIGLRHTVWLREGLKRPPELSLAPVGWRRDSAIAS